MRPIPFDKPFITGNEIDYIAQAVTSGKVASDGPFTRRCGAFLEERFGIRRAHMTPSCTAALEIGSILCDLEPEDEVIMPSFAFVATATAAVRMGATPVFVDVRPDTLNIDERLIEAAITPRTKAIFPVHYAGVSCAMDPIMEIAGRHGLLVVEDAAQGVNASYRGRPLGSIGHLGAYSFHATKNYGCGEGGALCVNDPSLADRAEIVREKGTNRSQFLRGQVDKYTWVDVGSSFILSELSCAYLCAQLEMLDEISSRRRAIYEDYVHHLRPLADDGLLTLPTIPEECGSNYHMFAIRLPDPETRNGLIAHLAAEGISAVFHYVPLHTSPMGRSLGNVPGTLPVTEDVATRLLRLPFFCDMTEDEQARVVAEVARYLRGALRKAA